MKNLKEYNLSKYSVTPCGNVYSTRSNRFLKNYEGTDGYYRLTLTDDEGKLKYWRVNRLVAFAYCEGYKEGLVVNHKDGDKLNNHYSNLEWVTISQNQIHAVENGLQTNAGVNTITPVETVHQICKMLEQGYRKKDVCELVDVSRKVVEGIIQGQNWSWISQEYSIQHIKKNNKLSLENVLRVCELLESKVNPKQIAKEIGCHWSTIYKIKNREYYSDITKNFHW